jgi:hypothetical protein
MSDVSAGSRASLTSPTRLRFRYVGLWEHWDLVQSSPEQPYALIALGRVAEPTLPGSAETMWKHWAERKKNGTIRSEC